MNKNSFIIIYSNSNNLTKSRRLYNKTELTNFIILNQTIIKLKIINYMWGLLPRELILLVNLTSLKLYECSCVFPNVSLLVNLEKITLGQVTANDRVTNLKSLNKLPKLKKITIEELYIDLVNLPNIEFDLIINNLNVPLTNLPPMLNKLIVTSTNQQLENQIKIPYGCQFIFYFS